MQRYKYFLLMFLALMLAPGLSRAVSQATPDEAKAMAIKAADYLKSVGPDKAFAAFDAAAGPWHDRDLYVTVENDQGIMVAHGTNPGLIGRSVLALRDVDGKPFNHDIQAIKTTGWVAYKWQDPLTKTVGPKRMYNIRVGHYIVGVGAYVK
jgi:cytochrome c